MDPLRIIIYAGILLALVPLTLGWKKRISYLWMYVLASFLCDCLISFVLRPLGYNRSWASNMFGLIEFVLITLYFREHVNTKFKPHVLGFLILVATLFSIHTIYNNVLVFNGTVLGFLNLIYVVYSMLGLVIIMQERKEPYIEKSEYFWANLTFIFYFSAGFMLYLFHDYLLVKDKDTLVKLWIYIHITRVILFRLMLIVPLTRKEP